MAPTAANETHTFKAPKNVSIALPLGDTVPTTNQLDGDDLVDRVSWPINRCCYEELTPAELTTIEQLFVSRDDTPSFMKWVVVHKSPHAFVKRLLVLSSFRVTLFKRSQSPFKSSLVVAREYQLLHLDEMLVLRLTTMQPSDPTAISTAIKMRFHSSKHPHDHDLELPDDVPNEKPHSKSSCDQEIHFDPGIHAETIVRLSQRLLHAMRLVFPGQWLPRLVLPPQCHWQEFFTVREPHPPTRPSLSGTTSVHWKEYGDAMATAYRCFCDDLDVPFRSSVATRLRECLDSSCVDFQYCLSAASASALHPQQPVIPARHYRTGGVGFLAALTRMLGLGIFSASAMQAKEVHALARTLEHCHCFEEIVAYDFPVSDMALRSLFHALVNPTDHPSAVVVKGISLTNVGLTTSSLRTLQHVVLQSTIRRPGVQLADLHPQVPSASFHLRRLDLSFNTVSRMMAHGLATILELLPSGLEVLQLEQCRLNMHASSRILSAMKASHGFSSCLRELNLSGNTLAIEGTKTLAMWITGAFALHRLDLSRTRLQTNTFFQAFKQNSILHESSLVSLDLSYNRMGSQASLDLGDILGKTQSLSTIVLRGMKQPLLHPRRVVGDLLSRQRSTRKAHKITGAGEQKQATHGLRQLHLRNILGPMLQNSSRSFPCMIDLSENNLHGPKATLVAHLIDSAPNASLASLRLDDAVLTDKAAVLLLHSLRACKTLESLSLEGNGFLRRNTTRSYKRFHSKPTELSPRVPAIVERAAADALSLLLGGKTTSGGLEPARESEDKDSAHSFTHLYLHRPKKVPLRELSLRSRGRVVFGEFILTTVVQALAVNTTLQMLDVSGNECGDALARALGDVLPVNKTLQVLYWDDNFTTVEGFFAFYEGLLRNQTLSVVQLPINDTRRILEEQKDPPREKLFSVLGKIFKVTERNQSLAHAARDHRKSTPTAKAAKTPRRKKDKQQNQSENQFADTAETTESRPPDRQKSDAEPEEKQGDETVLMPASTHHVQLSVQDNAKPLVLDAVSAGRYTTRTRYPTTIRSWARDASTDGADDVRASWDQIGSLASMLT